MNWKPKNIKPYYEDDNVFLIHGDCFEIIPKLNIKVDLVLTDPPYNFDHKGGGFYQDSGLVCGRKPRKYIKALSKLDCLQFEVKSVKSLLELSNNFVFCCNKSLVSDYILLAKSNNFKFDIHVIYKTNPIPAKNNHFLHNFEYVIMIRNSKGFWNKELPITNYNKLYQTICRPNNLHPAEKDINFCKKYIQILSSVNGLVLDPYAGSGTTGRACKDLGRKCVMIEKEEAYCEITANRMLQEVLL